MKFCKKKIWYTDEEKIIDAINWSWQNGADVLSNSWSGGSETASKNNAINNAIAFGRNGKGCVIVAASGNEGGTNISFPAMNNKVISVGAIYRSGQRPSSSKYGNLLDLVAPGIAIHTTSNNTTYFSNFNGTSAAAPHVAGVAALVLSINPDLTEQEVRNIIESTTQKIREGDLYTYSTHTGKFNGTWNDEVGYGLLDAYAAVQKAKETLKQNLYIRISPFDEGNEPRTYVSYASLWNSPDIWNRRSNDNGTTHQNIECLGFPQNHINIRITNRGKSPSTTQDSVRLHWAKAGTTLDWDMYWNGDLKYNNTPLGGVVATKAIPVLQPGETTIVKIPWSNVPNPINYGQTFENSQSFSLLARIISEDDPMAFPEGLNLMNNVKNNNNIAWKNVTVLFVRFYHPAPIGDVVIVRNPLNRIKIYDIGLKIDEEDVGKPVFQEAEVTATLDPVLYDA